MEFTFLSLILANCTLFLSNSFSNSDRSPRVTLHDKIAYREKLDWHVNVYAFHCRIYVVFSLQGCFGN